MHTHSPVHMEDHFAPGLKSHPNLFIGSQTSPFIRGNATEQAWEGFYLGAAHPSDIVVVRDFDPEYLKYWKQLMGDITIINLEGTNQGEFLTQVILEDQEIQKKIKHELRQDTRMMVFFPTELETELAHVLGVGLHGLHSISSLYGIKSGIRRLAEKNNILMPPGFICTTKKELTDAVETLGQRFDTIILKHDQSFSGYYSKKVSKDEYHLIPKYADEISNGKFTEGEDIIVVEGWLKAKASLCAHIEIIEGEDPYFCAGWQQVIDTDGITYMGAGPLRLSDKALHSFLEVTRRFAEVLKNEGAIGSFGPDFLITADDETRVEPDTAVLIELNARVPYTAIPLEIVKSVRGTVGHGFFARHVNVTPGTAMTHVLTRLHDAGLLVTEKSRHAHGVVPYNVGLLPWGIFDLVAMADSWEAAEAEMNHAIQVLKEIE